MPSSPLTDTDPRAQAFLTNRLREISPAEKLKQTFEMSHFVWQQAKQALLKRASTKSPQEQNRLFAEIFYPELTEHFAKQKDATMNTENKQEILEALSPFLKTLEKLGLEYQVVGSVASSAYGAARSTRDIDMVCALDASKVGELVSDLKDRYYIDGDSIHEAIKTSSSFNLIHLGTMFKLDVFVLKNTPYDKESFSRKRVEPLDTEGTLKIFLSSPEDVIIAKLNWYRLGGEISERQWQDISTVFQVQGTSLDQGYIAKWCKELGLLDLWERLTKQ
jgi:hypothetical protein